MERRTLITASVLILAMAGTGLYIYGKDLGKFMPGKGIEAKKEPPKKVPTVEVITVKSETFVQDINVAGSLRPNESVIISSEAEGRVSDIFFKEGMLIDKKQMLLKLDSRLEEAQLAAAQASFNNSKSSYMRASTLAARGVLAAQAKDDALAEMKKDEANVKLAKARIDKTVIYAPFSGVIGLREISPGDIVKQGQKIADLVDNSVMKADFSLPQSYYSMIKKGMEIEVTTDAVPGKKFVGIITVLESRVDEASRNIMVRAEIPNEDDYLKPGLFVNIRIIFETRNNVIMLPEESVFPEGEKNYVFVKTTDNKVSKREVITANRSNGQVEISNGVSVGDIVVTDGQMKLKDGSEVFSIQRAIDKPVVAEPKAP